MNFQELGQKIQMIREEKKISQEQLAQAIGCSQSALSNYEKGKRRIYLSQLEKLAEVLQKPLSFFVEGFEEEKAEAEAAPHHVHDNLRLKIINDTYSLSEDEIGEVDRFIQYLKWQREMRRGQ